MKKYDLRNIIREEIQNVLNEDVFVMWADRVTGDLKTAIKKAKYKGKGGVWSNDFKTNAKQGHGTVFFITADNVASAKEKLSSFTEKNKVDDNIYRLSESLLKEENYAEKLSKSLVKTKQVKKGISEKELISVIIKNAKKDIDPKTLKYWLRQDNDFLSDTISNVYELLGE